ncbi:MAG: bifunctional glutamate N-acetyltransferase/amino-acid acetyltransferase ArgJ [Planctomycetota bacterium]
MDPKTTISLPKGFRFAGNACGIKASGAKDISLVLSDLPAAGAGVYTQNQVVAAPVINCQSKTPSSNIRVVVTNSGNANACTGSQGVIDAENMCQIAAESCEVDADQTLVMSTGIIGHTLPMTQVEAGIRTCGNALGNSESHFLDSADGILTTDKARKIANRTLIFSDRRIQLVGMAKGAGMIGPNMATMLCTCLTDARLSAEQADRLLRQSANLSFNQVSVEGHTSTNDTMLLLANGSAGGEELTPEQETQFSTALTELAIELAKKIPMDGEGASHLIEIAITGAASDTEAETIARTVASSNLVKTAIYGNDPNWGRIVSAAGYAGPTLENSRLKLVLNEFTLFDAGEPIEFDEKAASASLQESETAKIEITVGSGPGTCTHWTSDLTVEYVRFNSEYST